MTTRLRASETEVGRIVLKEDAEEPKTVLALSAAGDDRSEGHQSAGALLDQTAEARPVSGGVPAGEVADQQSVDQHLDRVAVVGVVGLGHQQRVSLDSHALPAIAADEAPKCLLMVRLAYDLERLVAFVEGRLDLCDCPFLADESVKKPHSRFPPRFNLQLTVETLQRDSRTALRDPTESVVRNAEFLSSEVESLRLMHSPRTGGVSPRQTVAFVEPKACAFARRGGVSEALVSGLDRPAL